MWNTFVLGLSMALIALNMVLSVYLIEKPRKPMTASDASIVIGIDLIWLLLLGSLL